MTTKSRFALATGLAVMLMAGGGLTTACAGTTLRDAYRVPAHGELARNEAPTTAETHRMCVNEAHYEMVPFANRDNFVRHCIESG